MSTLTMNPIAYRPISLWTPNDSAFIWAYFEADSYALADGARAVTTWTDRSGNGRYATPTATVEPIFITNVLNGYPALYFTGGGAPVAYGFVLPDMAALTAGEMFLVIRKISDNGQARFMTCENPSAPDFYGDSYAFASSNITSSYGSTIQHTYAPASATFTDYNILDVYSAPSDWGMYFNGVLAGSTSTNTVRFNVGVPYQFGWFNGGNYLHGAVAALYLFSAKLSTTERTQMYGYLQDRYYTGPLGPAEAKNVALSYRGSVASASSMWSGTYAPSNANNSTRHTNGSWSAGSGGWHSLVQPTGGSPEWLEIDFGSTKTITEVDVITLADAVNYTTEPTLSDTFTQHGIVDFKTQYWNGSTWVDVDIVTGNNKVWRQFTWASISTQKIRLSVTGGLDSGVAGGYVRVVEFEAWGA